MLSLLNISQLIWISLTEACRIFEINLCLEFLQISEFDVQLLHDNWNVFSSEESFLINECNHFILKSAELWFLTQLFCFTKWMNIILQRDLTDEWHVNVDTLKKYKYSIQCFLKILITFFLLSSDQLTCCAEFLSLHWCNSMLQKHNLFIHDDWLVYILIYHKLINLINVFKWLIRFLLSEVVSLTVQFLALMISFCWWLWHSSSQKSEIFEYLWFWKNDFWFKDHLTAVIVSADRVWIEQNIHLHVWCQIIIVIVIKKFITLNQFWTEAVLKTDDSEIKTQITDSMLNVFHHQIAHTSHISNQIYSESVNFCWELTNIRLQEFLHISEMWHVFL